MQSKPLICYFFLGLSSLFMPLSASAQELSSEGGGLEASLANLENPENLDNPENSATQEPENAANAFDELALNDGKNLPLNLQTEVFPGFNKLYLADPLTLPNNFLAGYDPKNPDGHLDEEWSEKLEALFNASQYLIGQNQLTYALHTLEQALLIAPDQPLVRTVLGNCYFQLGFYDKALEQYSRVLSLFPEQANTRINRTRMLLMLGMGNTAKDRQNRNNEVITQETFLKRQSYFEQCLKDLEILLNTVQKEKREKPDLAKALQQQYDFFVFQIYLCQLGLNKENQAKRILSGYNPMDMKPTWFMMQAAQTLQQAKAKTNANANAPKLRQEAKIFIQSANRIYSTNVVNQYTQVLRDIGWL